MDNPISSTDHARLHEEVSIAVIKVAGGMTTSKQLETA
jgi:hypothetical protein